MDTLLIDVNARGQDAGVSKPCHGTFLLSQIEIDKPDKLGNAVEEILWCGSDYIIYRTSLGVFVNFSDCPEREKEQRQAFAEICPELCELRFLTHEMHGREGLWFSFRRTERSSKKPRGGGGASLFEHNMAQAIMLLMENKPEPAQAIAEAALAMAVIRSTNDNTIRYVKSSMVAAVWAAIPLAYFALFPPAFLSSAPVASTCFSAALFGVLGAAFSVIMRVQSFQMKPCQQSNMNYLMARTRIAIGLIAGLMLYLILNQPLGRGVVDQGLFHDWKAIAVIGFLGGFAERLVPTVFQRTAAGLEDSSGTPVQAVRRSDRHNSAAP